MPQESTLSPESWAKIEGVRNASSYLDLMKQAQAVLQPLSQFHAAHGGSGPAPAPGILNQLLGDRQASLDRNAEQARAAQPTGGASADAATQINPLSIEAYKADPIGYAKVLSQWSQNHPSTGTSDYSSSAPPDPTDPNYVEQPQQYAADAAQWLATRQQNTQSARLASTYQSDPNAPQDPVAAQAATALPQVAATAPGSLADLLSNPPQQMTSNDLLNSAPVTAQLTTADQAVPAQPQTPIPNGTVLQGQGLHQWIAKTDGNDILANGLATVFGGGNDAQDDSDGTVTDPLTGKEVHTPITQSTLGVSLPTGANVSTAHSPFPKLPIGTMVQVTNPKTGKTITVPIVDEGPSYTDTAGTGVNGSSMVDLTPATAKALGSASDPNTADPVQMQIRILGGANAVTSQNVSSVPDPTDFNPSDLQIIQQLGKAVYSPVGGKLDGGYISDLASQLSSGALTNLKYLLGSHAVDIDNNNGDADQLAQATQGVQSAYNQLHSAYLNGVAGNPTVDAMGNVTYPTASPLSPVLTDGAPSNPAFSFQDLLNNVIAPQ